MVNQNQREKFQTLIRGTIISLCQNVLEHKSEVKIDVFVGITIDRTEDFHFSIVETLRADDISGSAQVEKPPEASVSRQSPTSNNRTGNILEKLMVHDISSNRQGSISSSAVPKAREVSSTTVNDRCQSSSLSYSELLRSFGEMSRQDKPSIPTNPSTSCPTLLNTLSSPPSSHLLDAANPNPINQAQVVIPINFAIHSPSNHNSRSSSAFSIKEQSASDLRNYQWGVTPPSTSKMQRYDCEHPDTTYAMPDTHSGKSETDCNPYDVKVKQEVLSDEELEQGAQSDPLPYGLSNAPLNNTGNSKDSLTRPSPKGILMSLLCEKSPSVQSKKRGRPKKKAEDSLYVPPKQSKSDVPEISLGTRESKDNRVLIGLTDYLPGFKEGDLGTEKPPRCVFSGQDISAKTRKVVLLNSGPFSTVRMVHRSLQGMRATEINDIMREMTKPRQHPEYVGEYKAITMPKVRQGRRLVGVFYKCPPELLKPDALQSYDILLEDYKKFYEQMYKYDRTPKPPYFQSIEMFSPFSGTYRGKRTWREDPTFDPTTRLSEVYSASDLMDYNAGDDEEITTFKSEEQMDGPTVQVVGIKDEKVDWDLAEDDQTMSSTGVTTKQKVAAISDSTSPATGQENADSNTKKSGINHRYTASRESTPDDYNPNLVTFMPKNFGQQPVFPQPLIVREYSNGQPKRESTSGDEHSSDKHDSTEQSEVHSASNMTEKDMDTSEAEHSDDSKHQLVGVKLEDTDVESTWNVNGKEEKFGHTREDTTQGSTELDNGSRTPANDYSGSDDRHTPSPELGTLDGKDLGQQPVFKHLIEKECDTVQPVGSGE